MPVGILKLSSKFYINKIHYRFMIKNNLALISLMILLFLAGCNQKQPEQPIKSGDTITVLIQGFRYSPGTLTVKQGTKVIWTNQDSSPHTVTSSAFDSGTMQEDFSYTLDTRYEEKGAYDYSCSFHPYMKGKLVIE